MLRPVSAEIYIPVLEAWGLTETSPCVTATTKATPWKSGHVGLPLPGVKVRIDGNQEILIKGPNVMEGYLHDPEATAHTISEDGWLYSGDLGEWTKDGLRLLGRRDGTFKLTTGEKVHSLRVETALVNESPYVDQAVVVGSGKDYVAALVYPDLGALRAWAADHHVRTHDLLREEAVKDLYAVELARVNPQIEIKYERLRRVVLADRPPTVESGELTPSGKLVRKRVLENFKNGIDALFQAAPPPEIIKVQSEPQRTVSSET